MSDLVEIRKLIVQVEDIHHDGGPRPATPHRRAAAAAIIKNPYAGQYVADIQPMMEALKPLGLAMSKRLIAALGDDPLAIDGYGKGAIVGTAGELEHGALWHVPGGYAMRELLGESKAIVPSAMKSGGVGATLDVPLGHINAAYVRSHFDAFEIRIADAPRADEMLLALAMSIGGRIHARVGGLQAEDVKGDDGLR